MLLYEGCFASEAFTLADLLHIGNHAARRIDADRPPPFEVRTVGARRAEIATATGHRIRVDPPRRAPDVLVVPGFDLLPVDGLEGRLAALEQEVAMVRRRSRAGAHVASICVGAFLLGRAGVLDGRRATTAWLFADSMAAMFPAVSVDASAMLVEDDRVTTTAAFSAAADLAHALLVRHAGPEVARIASRVTLTAEQRESQTPYVDRSLLGPRPSTVLAVDVRSWLADHLDEPFDLTRVATEFHVSTRTLLRHFGQETGTSPLQYLHRLRVERAKGLLESTDAGLHEIAAQVGYRDVAAFRKVFRAQTATTPSAYRARFRRAGSHQGLAITP
ncbi:MAG TPA: helix-turn-helix domain-containing protein [Iamia sp.]